MNFYDLLKQLVKSHYGPKEPTPANKRAAARLEAHRKIWDNTPSADKMTRQRRAAQQRGGFRLWR